MRGGGTGATGDDHDDHDDDESGMLADGTGMLFASGRSADGASAAAGAYGARAGSSSGSGGRRASSSGGRVSGGASRITIPPAGLGVDDDDDDDDDDDHDDDYDRDDAPAGSGGLTGTAAGARRGSSVGVGKSAPDGPGSSASSAYSGSARSGGSDKKRELSRLERNREAARQSRKRKKQYLELLTQRVRDLHSQVAALRAAHCAAAEESLQSQRLALLTRLEPIAYKATVTAEEEAALYDGAAQLLDRYGPNCAERRTVRDFHFDQLQRLLLPPHLKFLLWMLHQPFNPAPTSDPAVLAAAKQTQELWSMLCTEIGLQPDQAEKLR